MQQVALVALSALLLLIPAVFEPFMSISSMGISASMSLYGIIPILYDSGWSSLLAVFLPVCCLFPVILLLILTLCGLTKFRVGRCTAQLYQFSFSFCMVDVFVLGVAVSLIKLSSLTQVAFHSGFYVALLFSMMLIWCCTKVRPGRIWDEVTKSDLGSLDFKRRGRDQGVMVCQHCGMQFKVKTASATCPRCLAQVQFRRQACIEKTLALLLSAAIMFMPSNIYPIMFTNYLGKNIGSNIVDGVVSLWGMGSWFVAAVIMFASLFIPAFKILALGYLLWTARHGRNKRSRFLSRVYRVVALIGKWSMIDVFVVIIMSSIVRMTGLLVMAPGLAIICFCLVVLITLLAAEGFDERLLWD